MATRKKPCTEAIATARRGLPPAYYQLHAVLETVRAMQCYEDELCTLLGQIQRSGKVGAGLRREILKTLRALPVMSLHAELDATLDALEEAAA
jgi:hypothetical protein